MPFSPFRLAAKLLALFLLILGAKFCVMRACSSPLPFFDQWNGEGTDLLQPWVHGSWHWTQLFAFHVQHRIALTRLLVLGLFQANGGQWDTQVEMIAAAVFHALGAVVLGAVLARRLGPALEDKLIFGLALLFMLPFGWENTLSGGFQSQFYFLLGLSFVALWGLVTQRPGAAGWWTGVAAAVLAWFSMGSAPLAPLAVAAVLALRWWRPAGASGRPRADQVALGTALGLFVVGVCVMLGSDPNSNLQPRSPGAFVLKFLGLLGWPNPTALAAPLAYAPWAFLLVRRLREPGRPRGQADELLLALGTFTVLQTAAIAFGRNQYRGLVVSRYMDVLSIGAFVNFACLLQLAVEKTRTARENAWLRATGAGWLGLLAWGLSPLTIHDLNGELPFMRDCNALEDTNVAALIAHPDPALLKDKNAFDFQCQDARLMMKLVQDPLLAGAWPVHARRPLPLTPVAAAGRLSALTDDTPTAAAPVPPPVGWTLLPPAAGERATTFRSQTIAAGGLPYLVFAVRGEIGPSARLALVGERTGQMAWVLPPEKTARGAWWTVPVAVPPGEAFHVEATVTAGGTDGLAFLFPREMGGLSAWVDPLLDGAVGWLFAGVALWLAAGLAGAGSERSFNAETRSAPRHAERMERPVEEAALA